MWAKRETERQRGRDSGQALRPTAAEKAAHLEDMACAFVGERPRDVVPRIRAGDQAGQRRGSPVEAHTG
eukprot:COSAG02_NODE_996_length_15338_cov_3.867577_4_plen_69_part_00